MNQLFKTLLSIVVIFLIFFSCKEKLKEKKFNTKELTEIGSKNEEWSLVWLDEFDSDTIDSNNWNLQVLKAGQFNDEWQRYTDSNENAFIENGNLVIKALHESDTHGIDQYSSARLNTANKQSWKYGKIEARIKLPKGKGIWPAFWMLGGNIDENGGDTPWPQCGEIDILELYGTKHDAVVEANLHYADQSNSHAMMGAKSYKLDKGIFADDFHIFALEWDDKNIKWLVDGYQYAITSISQAERSEFHKDFFILLNLAVGGTYAGRPDTSTPFPQLMYVDWVKVYQNNQSS